MKAYQLKITIKDSHPPIWRRLIVPSGLSFSQLTLVINTAFGWCGYHMSNYSFHQLKLDLDDDYDEEDSWAVFDHEILDAARHIIDDFFGLVKSFTYTYDFGDDWRHQVQIEKVIKDYEYNYPQVIKYKGDTPYEDCGGIWGYYELRDILSNPGSPEYEAMKEWTDAQFDNSYDMEYVNSELERMRLIPTQAAPMSRTELYERYFSGQADFYTIVPVSEEENEEFPDNKEALKERADSALDSWGLERNVPAGQPAGSFQAEPRSIVVLGNWLGKDHKDKISRLAREKGFLCSFYNFEQEEGAKAALAKAEVVFGHAPETAASSRTLKWLCLPSAGADIFLRPGALLSPNLILTNSSGAYGTTMAEHMIMQTLMLLRRMPEFQEGMRERGWPRPRAQASIKDSRVTVLGAGDIGCCFARRVRAFEPRSIIAVNLSGKSRMPVFDQVLPWTSLDQVLPETDILAMSLPSTAQTRGILNAHRISLLPETAYIINVGRGDAIDEAALVKALNEGRLAGAALDVMQHEPLPKDDPLWEAKNILLTPHVAGNMTINFTKDRAVDMFCEDLKNYSRGWPLLHTVNKKLGY